MRFKTFKRGQLIYANFSPQIGNEIKGHHYAIVLTKEDNPFSGLLTVVPLTSKKHSKDIPLKNVVEVAIRNKLLNKLKEIEIITRQCIESYENDENLVMMNDYKVLVLASKSPKNGETFDFSVVNDDDLNNCSEMLKNYIKVQIETKTLFDKLSTISKDSFAKIDQITTISKWRIDKDKSNILKDYIITDKVLDVLDLEIVKRYTKFDTNNKR